MRRLCVLIASLLACAVVFAAPAAASPAPAAVPSAMPSAVAGENRVDAARACQEQSGGGIAVSYYRGILCGNYGGSVSRGGPQGNFNATGSANPWRYCWDHHRQGASYQWWPNRWVCK